MPKKKKKNKKEENFNVFMYDHTIDKLPKENKDFHWSKIGICGKKAIESCKTLTQILTDNRHLNEDNLILKMDVEGAEFDCIDETDSSVLNKFNQIVLEFHNLTDKNNYDKKIGCFEKLNQTHQVVHIHANNCSFFISYDGLCLPDTLEVLYVRKFNHQFKECKYFYPRKYDMPNDPYMNDIQLGFWNIN